jgi:hypothetical protein
MRHLTQIFFTLALTFIFELLAGLAGSTDDV